MDAFVSARVPVEIKDKVAKRLRGIGATQTDLVNAAFAYVLDTGELPRARKDTPTGARSLSVEQAQTVKRWLAETTYPVPESAWEGKSYKEILDEGRQADYEALS